MSETRFGRPLYHSNKATLVDIISENIYYNSKEFKDNLVKAVSKTYDRAADFYKNDQNALPFTIGTLSGIVANVVATDYASNHDFSPAAIKLYSYWGESGIGSAVATIIYFGQAYIRGIKHHAICNELWNTAKDLGKLVPFTAALSFGPYRIVKNMVSDIVMYFGVSPDVALPLVQTALLYPFVKSIEYTQASAKYAVESIRYFKENPGSFRKSLLEHKETFESRFALMCEKVKDKSGLVYASAKDKSFYIISTFREKMRA